MGGRPGLIEHHPERQEIENEIMARVPFRTIATRHGIGSHASVSRYVNKRMPKYLRDAYEREGESPNADLIADIREVYAALRRLAREAEATKDRQAKSLFLRAAQQVLPFAKAIAEMRGDLSPEAEGAKVQVINVQVNYAPAPWVNAEVMDGEASDGNGGSPQ